MPCTICHKRTPRRSGSAARALRRADPQVRSRPAKDARYYFNARFYDAERGAFIGRDSKGIGFSPYPYSGNMPLAMVDPDGMAPEPITVATTIPLSFWNMYKTQQYMVNQGAGYWPTVWAGAGAFAATWAVSLATMPGAASWSTPVSQWLRTSAFNGTAYASTGAASLTLRTAALGGLSSGLSSAATQLTLHPAAIDQWDHLAIVQDVGEGVMVGASGGAATKLGFSYFGQYGLAADAIGFGAETFTGSLFGSRDIGSASPELKAPVK